MHSLWARANGVLVFSLAGLLLCAFMCFVSSFYQTGNPSVSVFRLNTITGLHRHAAEFTFDLKADLGSTFNWNVKQLFVYVVAEYEAPKGVNQIVVWDRIVQTPEEAVLDERAVMVEYPLTDTRVKLLGKNVTLRLMWETMALTGQISLFQNGTFNFILPEEVQG